MNCPAAFVTCRKMAHCWSYPSAEDVPFRFWLKLDGETAPHFCTVAWRSARHLGVEFSQQITERRITERRAFAII